MKITTKIFRVVFMLPVSMLMIIYAIYCIIMVHIKTNYIELEMMGEGEVTRYVVDKLVKPIMVENKLLFKFISALGWITLILNIYVY